MRTCSKSGSVAWGAMIAAALIALVAAFALSSVADAAASLSFKETPTGWSVTSGEANDNVGEVQAKGLKKKNRIRYSLAGPSSFSIKPRTGIVQYDGSAISSDVTETHLAVTATDRQGKASPATITITVSVTAEPVSQRQDPVFLPQGSVPAKPTGLSAGGQRKSVHLSWVRDRSITGYELLQRVGNSGSWGAWTAITAVTTYDVTGLLDGTTYCFRIRAVNANGVSMESDEACATTWATGAGDGDGDGEFDAYQARIGRRHYEDSGYRYVVEPAHSHKPTAYEGVRMTAGTFASGQRAVTYLESTKPVSWEIINGKGGNPYTATVKVKVDGETGKPILKATGKPYKGHLHDGVPGWPAENGGWEKMTAARFQAMTGIVPDGVSGNNFLTPASVFEMVETAPVDWRGFYLGRLTGESYDDASDVEGAIAVNYDGKSWGNLYPPYSHTLWVRATFNKGTADEEIIDVPIEITLIDDGK